MKAILLAAALMLAGTQAHASWAEGANKQYPVYTGTNAALARAQAATTTPTDASFGGITSITDTIAGK